MRFEHRCQIIETKGWFSRGVIDPNDLQSTMNELGDSGFELVSVIPISDGNVGTARIALFYKKQILNE